MAVYVDPLRGCIRSKHWRWDKSCHLTADDYDELHRFAARLGLRRDWFQHRQGHLAHYDLTEGKRAEAVRLGAVELTIEQMVERIRASRHPVGLPTKRH